MMRWIVGPADGATLRDVLVRAGADLHAVVEGRVFVKRRRARRDTEPVHEGDEVFVAPVAQPVALPVRILARTRDLVLADKPAGIPTIGDHSGVAHSLVALVAGQTGVDVSQMHPTSRLDRDVSGVVVFATTKVAARRLAEARGRAAYERRYVAIASREPVSSRGTWSANIGRARDPRLRAVGGRDAVAAQTRYAVCGRTPGGAALLCVEPATGRTHQIRVHASNAGAPLIGDAAYGGPSRLTLPGGRVIAPGRIALHASRVVVPDERSRPVVGESPVPAALLELWTVLGGPAAAWELTESCALT
jgi:23S rRNA-/tRNA-specific pseudouridylate synthase